MKRNPQNLEKFWFKRKTLFFMKNFILIMLISSMNMYAASSYSQLTKISLELNDAELKEVLREIRKQTDYTILYKSADVRNVSELTHRFEEATVMEILDKCLEGKALDYKIKDKVIVIHPKYDRNVLDTSEQSQKKKQIKGKVVDKDGVSLPGVSVIVKGTTTGVITDIDGNYVINLPENKNTLVFSFVGMSKQELEATSEILNVTMQASSVDMDEVIVVAYGTQKKSSFTGSVSVVKEKALREASDASPLRALQGKAAGVVVSQTSGQPGAMPTVRIRGIGSINGNRSPLYVIDGIAVEAGNFSNNQTSASVLSLLNAEDIESQTILKDAAATSLYGSRGANGVVLITTKSGKEGKAKVNFSAEYGYSDFANPSSHDYMNAEEYAKYSLEALTNYWLDYYDMLPGQDRYDEYEDKYEDAQNWAYLNLDNKAGLIHPLDNGDGTFDYGNMSLEQAKMYITDARNVNWKDEIFRKGNTQKYDVSVRGGSKKIKYYTSLGYFKQEGIIKGSEYERSTGMMTLDAEITKGISIRFSEKLSYAVQEGAREDGRYYINPIYAYYSINPTAPVYFSDGSLNQDPGFSAKTTNPIHNQAYNTRVTKTVRSMSNLNLTLKITDYLRFESKNSIDFINPVAKTVTSAKTKEAVMDRGKVYKRNDNIWDVTTSNQLHFNKTFDEHRLSATAVYECRKYSSHTLSGTTKNFATHRLMFIGNGAEPSSIGGQEYDKRLLSYLGKFDYSYKNTYFLSGAWRKDGSSKLSKETRWGDFYSGSAAWAMSEEDFMNSVEWLDLLKIKLSYGTNGNLPTSFYSTLGLFSVTGNYSGEPTYSLYQPENEALKWEKSYTWNTGVDFSLLGNKIKGSIEFFHKTTKDLINNTSLLHASGYSSITENRGELLNKGAEFEISTINMETDNFSWTTDFNISHVVSRIKEIDGTISSYPYKYGKGDDIYTYYLTEWAGVNTETGQPQWYKNKELEDGTIDRSITTDPTEAEYIQTGKATPDFYGGITNNFKYKNFDLSFLATYRIGGQLFDGEHNYFSDGWNVGRANIRKNVIGKHWQKPGDHSEFSRLIHGAPEKGWYASTRRLVDGDYLKLKNITFGYNLPKSMLTKLKLEKLRFYFNATDVFTLFKEKHLDPEVGQNGFIYGVTYFPSLKTYRLGLNIQF